MIKLLKKIRKYCLRSKYNNTGLLGSLIDWVDITLGSLIGRMERVREVLFFIPVIYKCYRWDYSSLFIIMRHWLGRMEDVHANDPYHLDAKKMAKQIHLCTLLLDRIIEDKYDNLNTFDLARMSNKEFRQHIVKSENMRNQDINLLFKTIKTKHSRWWC